MTTDGFYELSVDFIEIPALDENGLKLAQPDCQTTSYARYLELGDDPWEVPPAPNGSIGWTIEYSFFVTSIPTEVGTGDVPPIQITTSTPGFGGPTVLGCPVHVAVTYHCPNSPLTPDVSFPTTGTARGDFIELAQTTKNASQLTQLDRILLMVGRSADGDYFDLWGTIYDEAQAFLLANPDYILDMSELEMTNVQLLILLTEIKKLNLRGNLLGGGDASVLSSLPLTYLDMSYNLLGGTHDVQFLPMLSNGLVHLDISHNQMQEYYLFSTSNGGGNWIMDYVDISANFFAIGDYAYMQTKTFKFTDNVFPTVDFWLDPAKAGENLQQNTGNFGSNWQDIELIDLSNTQIAGSLDIPPTSDAHIITLLNAIVADGHTLDEAKVIVVRDPKWENEEYQPYDPSDIFND